MNPETYEQSHTGDDPPAPSNRRSILFIEDELCDFEGAAQYLLGRGYCCARLDHVNSRELEPRESCLPPALATLIENGLLAEYRQQDAPWGDMEAMRSEDQEKAPALRDQLAELVEMPDGATKTRADRQAEVERQFRTFAGAAVDVMFPAPGVGQSPSGPEGVVAVRRLRRAIGVPFRICVWTRLLVTPAYVDETILQWGADCCVSKSEPHRGAEGILRCMET